MNKSILLVSIAVLAFSCGGENESADSGDGNILEDLSYSVDTLMVDPGEEIINLQWGLRLADLSGDKRKLYLLDETSTSIAEVDLQSLKLTRKHPFEKDGPNGIGAYISDFSVTMGENFLISSFQSSGIFNISGEKLEDLKFTPNEIQGIESDDDRPMTHELTLNGSGGKAFALPGDFFEGTRDFAVIDVASKSGKILDIPAMDIAGEFRIVLRSDEMMSIYIEELKLSPINGQIFILNSASADMYRYDPEQDSLALFSFKPSLFPAVKSGPVKNEVSSEEEWEAEMQKLSNQIGFEDLIWDEKSRRFFRFARKYYPRENEDMPIKVDVFLMAFDEELNLIGETQLEELKAVPAYPFFKDGKLWSYVNVDDELGFVVFDFEF